jgi:hypothetical protein
MPRRRSRPPGAQNVFRHMHLNCWTEQADRWIDLAAWDACAGPVSPGIATGAVPLLRAGQPTPTLGTTLPQAALDGIRTPNTIGPPLYAKQAVDQQFARWVMLHVQSNPLPICTRPRGADQGQAHLMTCSWTQWTRRSPRSGSTPSTRRPAASHLQCVSSPGIPTQSPASARPVSTPRPRSSRYRWSGPRFERTGGIA